MAKSLSQSIYEHDRRHGLSTTSLSKKENEKENKKHAVKKVLEKHGEKKEERKFDVKKFNTFVGKDAPRMAAESNAYNKRHGIKDQTYKAR
jgi:hypothetical protein